MNDALPYNDDGVMLYLIMNGDDAAPDYDEVMLHLMMMEVMLLLIHMIMMNDGVNDDEGE